jgi:tRNA threonylcarbamoyladenosine biosynthesis protein TsaB
LLGLSEKGGPLHTTALLEEIERAVEAMGGWSAVERIAVGVGPGSFTGLRVGIATARALGLSRGIRVIGVPTLGALARAIGERAGERASLAVIDARRGEVFAALYRAGGERIRGPEVSSPESLAESVAGTGPLLCAGPGAVRFRHQLANRGVEIPDDADPLHRVAARHLCEIAAEARGEGVAPVLPIYLRPPDAERWRERDTVQKSE